MAARLITSTDDPLYVNSIVTLADMAEVRTVGTVLGTTVKWSDKWTGKIFCDEGCINGRCMGHALIVNKGSISKHPAWKHCVYHYESYSNGTNRAVLYFYEEETKADLQAEVLRKRGRSA